MYRPTYNGGQGPAGDGGACERSRSTAQIDKRLNKKSLAHETSQYERVNTRVFLETCKNQKKFQLWQQSGDPLRVR